MDVLDVLDRMNGDWFLISDWSLLPVYSFDLTMHLVAFFFFSLSEIDARELLHI